MPHDAEITGYLFRHARDSILVICAATGGILEANPAAVETYRYTREELLALEIYDLRGEPGPSFAELVQQATPTGVLFETVHKRSDGTTFPVEISARGEATSDGVCLFCIIRDITERKRLEAERDELLFATQRALAIRDEFLLIASHELRAPVTNISLQLQQLSRLIERGTVRAALRVVGEAVHGEALRLASLIDALLDAQAVKGQLVLNRGDVELSALVGDVVDRLRPRAEQAGSELVVEVPEIHGCWDRMRIDQVVSNLITNAIKYGRGRPVRVMAAASGPHACIEIADEGIGVSQDDLDRIFGKFERAVPSQYGGLGLGLFIARQIVEAHDGHIHVHSIPGIGSTFQVKLPRS